MHAIVVAILGYAQYLASGYEWKDGKLIHKERMTI
jgi:hypothetical protein